MAKVTITQSELNTLFDEKVELVEGNVTRRVSKLDVAQKLGVPGDFDIIVEADPEQAEPDYND